MNNLQLFLLLFAINCIINLVLFHKWFIFIDDKRRNIFEVYSNPKDRWWAKEGFMIAFITSWIPFFINLGIYLTSIPEVKRDRQQNYEKEQLEEDYHTW